MRVVSLVPSLTELVWFLAPGSLAGRTRFCTEPPEMAARVPTLGGTKDPDVAAIAALEPDLVIANLEENRREDVEALQGAGLRVLVTVIDSLEEATGAIETIGRAVGSEAGAQALAREVEEARGEARGEQGRPLRVFVPIWRRPLLGLGGGTYGNSVLEAAGAVNVLGDRVRYPEVTFDEVAGLRPELVLLPDEPYRFREAHAAEFARLGPVRLIDGKLLWWYGPRLPGSLRRLRTIIEEAR
jgi:ABC-type Fe3+-hydroxamate transport system substrate-binding protein